ncbi:ATP synthase F0 subunit B [Desulfovibrio ferrophilus]|uniref:H+ transporting two-sector ATPase B/B' subunit n=1 Tax=Desulfovibrio ferrophilus TaxID=241368 RepID=A0A2Z6B2H8_9BACT|nr:ATP synthase F0 subunit B [Desulfovibrio ferrophilus]BBD09663.1 H+ transporting two-sector ATPase B/B' subunit [Desulfovibrio ferrophilus]
MIDLDSTFFIQFLNFIITLVVLNFLLIRPIRDIISRRNDAMSAMVDEAENFTNSAEGKLKNYQKQLDEARIAGTEKRNGLKDEGTAQEKGILSAAGEQASATLKAERETVAGEVRTAMDGLKGQVDALAGKAADKVLG